MKTTIAVISLSLVLAGCGNSSTELEDPVVVRSIKIDNTATEAEGQDANDIASVTVVMANDGPEKAEFSWCNSVGYKDFKRMFALNSSVLDGQLSLASGEETTFSYFFSPDNSRLLDDSGIHLNAVRIGCKYEMDGVEHILNAELEDWL